VAGGLVKTTRGARGGVLLLKSPAEIKLSEVIKCLEGSIAPVDCVDSPETCSRSAFCVTRDIWGEVKEAMGQVLDSTTLQDLVERQKQKRQIETGMYYI
jgi:Rrf2 family protein